MVVCTYGGVHVWCEWVRVQCALCARAVRCALHRSIAD